MFGALNVVDIALAEGCVLSTSIKRFTDPVDFFESINL